LLGQVGLFAVKSC